MNIFKKQHDVGSIGTLCSTDRFECPQMLHVSQTRQVTRSNEYFSLSWLHIFVLVYYKYNLTDRELESIEYKLRRYIEQAISVFVCVCVCACACVCELIITIQCSKVH